MNEKRIECDESWLQILLDGDETSNEFLCAAEHLEECADCRNRLTAIAASEEVWGDVSSLLRGYDGTDGFEPVPEETAARDLSRQLDFLSPPSHPEMLGRLGRYEIERVLGSGGMGIVLKGYDTELNRPVAIKVLAPYLAHNGAARQRFAREGRAAAAIVHEHVVAIHNVDTQAEMPYLVMQYVAGESLQTRVDQHGPLDVSEILRIGIQTAAGLTAAHAQGVIHRDIKPSNILLEENVDRVLLTDFGLARAVDDATVTHSGVIAGTPHYMSPEQASGKGVDERTDLFSLGALLYFMATGHPPFRADRSLAVLNRICHDHQRPVWEVNSDVPDELSDLIDRLLEKKPERRFHSAEQVRESLLKLLERRQSPGASRRRNGFRRIYSRHKRLLVSVSGALAGLALIVVMVGVLTRPESRPPTSSEQVETNKSIVEMQSEAKRTFEEYVAADAEPSRAFVAELGGLQSDLAKLESTVRLFRPALAYGDALWSTEIQTLHRQLSEVEKKQLSNSLIKGAE